MCVGPFFLPVLAGALSSRSAMLSMSRISFRTIFRHSSGPADATALESDALILASSKFLSDTFIRKRQGAAERERISRPTVDIATVYR